MFTMILGFLARLPSWIKLGGVFLVLFLVFEFKHKREVGQLKKQLTVVYDELKTEQLKGAKLELSVHDQNAAIQELSTRTAKISSEATNRALRVMRAEQKKS